MQPFVLFLMQPLRAFHTNLLPTLTPERLYQSKQIALRRKPIARTEMSSLTCGIAFARRDYKALKSNL